MSDHHSKLSLYFPDNALEEIHNEAMRLDRSLSWVVQQAWMLARKEIQSRPTVAEHLEHLETRGHS